MEQGDCDGNGEKWIIRLMGFEPHVSPEAQYGALSRLFRRSRPEAIRRALSRLPLVLTRSASGQQAQKIQRFLESRGAVLEVEPTGPPGPGKATPPSPPASGPAAANDRGAWAEGRKEETLHPMGLGEILDLAFRILRRRFWLFLVIMAIPSSLPVIYSAVAAAVLRGVGAGVGRWPDGVPIVWMAGMGLAGLLALVVFLIVQIWASGALIRAVCDIQVDRRVTIGTAFGAVRPMLWRLLGTILLVWVLLGAIGLAISGSMLLLSILSRLVETRLFSILAWALGTPALLLVPAVALLNWLMADKVVVLEALGGWRALKRSRELMMARNDPGFWKRPKMRASLLLLVLFLVFLGAMILFIIPSGIIQFLLPGQFVVLRVLQLGYSLVYGILWAYGSIALVLFYYDLRIRKEDFGLQALARSL